jgi:putative toxin-antitoxin system antitoxin component (TIGR02293 family)
MLETFVYRVRLELFLHIPKDASDQEIHELIEAGFSSGRLKALCELGAVSPSERDKIISLKTLKSRLARDQRLTVNESDLLFRFVHITAMAEALFDDDVKARRWLSKPKDRLSGKSPIEMLSTLHGTRRVEEMLIRVAEAYAL